MSKDDRVNEILSRYGEDMSATWMVQGQRVIKHQALERIAIKAGILWNPPNWLITAPDCAVVQASGHLPYGRDAVADPSTSGRFEWSVGEAHVGKNYRVSDRVAAYPFAMAEKRAKDRVILKLIALHGLVYSEEEADDFKESAPKAYEPSPAARAAMAFANSVADSIPTNDREAVMQEAVGTNKTVEMEDGEVSPFNAMRRMIDQKSSVEALTAFMLNPQTKAAMAAWSDKDYQDAKEYAKQRLVTLGWKSSNGPRA